MDVLTDLSRQVGERLLQLGWMLATAESCTGGWVAQSVTAIEGSSQWFDRGFVTYSNQAKQDMLAVSSETLVQHGAVSEATVLEMAAGAVTHSRAQCALAISGIAGPGGGTEAKPVGTVCFAWCVSHRSESICCHFDGDRAGIRRQSVEFALRGLLQHLESGVITS